VGFTEQERGHMHRALGLAELGRGLVEPNPMVGCVIVKDGRLIGEGCHRRFGGPHAEVHALQAAGDGARGATMYVTLEPCDHEDKTPACAPVVARAGLRRVVACTLDPTALNRGGGMEILGREGVTAEVGLCREEAVRLNAGFFKLAVTGRPLVTAKWAMSADGKIATSTGGSRHISSPQSQRLVHELRGRVDCIIVGSRTVERDDPLLTCREGERRRTAARLVLCGDRAPAADAQLVRSADQAPVLLAYPADRPPDRLSRLVEAGCEALPVDGGAAGAVDLGRLLDTLGARRMTNVLVEGGAEVLGSFFDAALVDRVMVFVAPLVIGGARAVTAVAGGGVSAIEDALRLRSSEVTTVGTDALISGWAVDPLEWAP
jgi:diaminohydroxyphosphoribosylaminopyrimidine deaminase/5-amino-6-(5-phosphoribosylamino)uracil reductase